MGLRRLCPALRDHAFSHRHCSHFRAACHREPALDAHRSVGAVLEALDARDADGAPDRESLVRALLREQQRTGESYWVTVLVVAFAPMLRALRSKIQGDALSPEDLDQLVLEGFLRAVARRPLDAPRAVVQLRWDTQRFVFRSLQAEQRRIVNQRMLEQRARSDDAFELYAWKPQPMSIEDDERAELEALLRHTVAGDVSTAKLDVVVATRLRGAGLRELALERLPGAGPEELEVEYERLKRERLRTLRRLKTLLALRLFPPDEELAPDSSSLRVAS